MSIHHHLLICLVLTLSGFSLFGQTKTDLIEILEAIAEDPQADPLFQVDLPGGKAMVLLRDLRRDINPGTRAMEQLFYDLLDEDLTFAAKPIRVMSEQEAIQQGADPQLCTTIGYRIQDDQADIMLRANIEGDRQYFQGAFTLRKEFSGWKVTGRNIRLQ